MLTVAVLLCVVYEYYFLGGRNRRSAHYCSGTSAQFSEQVWMQCKAVETLCMRFGFVSELVAVQPVRAIMADKLARARPRSAEHFCCRLSRRGMIYSTFGSLCCRLISRCLRVCVPSSSWNHTQHPVRMPVFGLRRCAWARQGTLDLRVLAVRKPISVRYPLNTIATSTGGLQFCARCSAKSSSC